jgi:hypothetical protein
MKGHFLTKKDIGKSNQDPLIHTFAISLLNANL